MTTNKEKTEKELIEKSKAGWYLVAKNYELMHLLYKILKEKKEQ